MSGNGIIPLETCEPIDHESETNIGTKIKYYQDICRSFYDLYRTQNIKIVRKIIQIMTENIMQTMTDHLLVFWIGYNMQKTTGIEDYAHATGIKAREYDQTLSSFRTNACEHGNWKLRRLQKIHNFAGTPLIMIITLTFMHIHNRITIKEHRQKH
eukprot:187810_1